MVTVVVAPVVCGGELVRRERVRLRQPHAAQLLELAVDQESAAHRAAQRLLVEVDAARVVGRVDQRERDPVHDAVIAVVAPVVARVEVARRRHARAVVHHRRRPADGVRLREVAEAAEVERAVPAVPVERDPRAGEIRLGAAARGRADDRDATAPPLSTCTSTAPATTSPWSSRACRTTNGVPGTRSTTMPSLSRW